MTDRIIPLICPSCGDGRNDASQSRSFGAEFKCGSCGVTSALIINHQLHMVKAGEHVCKSCGRVAASGARFCQCGSSLVRSCVICKHEHFVDHKVCPQCGWSTEKDMASLALQDEIANTLKLRMEQAGGVVDSERLEELLACISVAGRASSHAVQVLKPVILSSEFLGQQRILQLLPEEVRVWLRNIQSLESEISDGDHAIFEETNANCNWVDPGTGFGGVLGIIGGIYFKSFLVGLGIFVGMMVYFYWIMTANKVRAVQKVVEANEERKKRRAELASS